MKCLYANYRNQHTCFLFFYVVAVPDRDRPLQLLLCSSSSAGTAPTLKRPLWLQWGSSRPESGVLSDASARGTELSLINLVVFLVILVLYSYLIPAARNEPSCLPRYQDNYPITGVRG